MTTPRPFTLAALLSALPLSGCYVVDAEPPVTYGYSRGQYAYGTYGYGYWPRPPAYWYGPPHPHHGVGGPHYGGGAAYRDHDGGGYRVPSGHHGPHGHHHDGRDR